MGDRLWVGRRPGPWLLRLGLRKLQGAVGSGELRGAPGLALSEEAAVNPSPPAQAQRPRSPRLARRCLPDPPRAARDRSGSVRGCGGNRRAGWTGPFLPRTRLRRRGVAAGPTPSPEVRPWAPGLPGRGPPSLSRVPKRRIGDLARAARLLLGVWHRALWRGDLSSLFLLGRGIYLKGTRAL